jgi:hypothetical protein
MNEIPHQMIADPLEFSLIAIGLKKFILVSKNETFKAGNEILIFSSGDDVELYGIKSPMKKNIDLVFHGDGNALNEGFCILQIS